MSKMFTERGRVAALSRSRRPDDPDLIDAHRRLTEARLEAYIRRTVDAAPLLSAETRDRLAVLLRGAEPPGKPTAVLSIRRNHVRRDSESVTPEALGGDAA